MSGKLYGFKVIDLRALLSTYDRTGLVDFANVLINHGYELVSTGGTLQFLEQSGLQVTQVSDITRFKEILDGRVKTLHPSIHGGILARRDSSNDLEELANHEIATIDIVVNNLYPFAETISNPDKTLNDALDNIDIGGPAMTRAAAKNYPSVIVLVDPLDYPTVASMISDGMIPMVERRRLASKAFKHVAIYDTKISNYLNEAPTTEVETLKFPDELKLKWDKVSVPRYGENPHQKASIYVNPEEIGGIANAQQLHGVELSYLNYLDADAAWSASNRFPNHCVTIVKHANPCGLSVQDKQSNAYLMAFEGDPVSAFGGIVGFNSVVQVETANLMRNVFFDVIIAPDYEPDALRILKERKRTRILTASSCSIRRFDLRSVSGGILVQEPDDLVETPEEWSVVTNREPDKNEILDLHFAWNVCRLVRSNAIVFAKNNSMIGMGSGQPNRVTSVYLSGRLSGEQSVGASMASDAFFPFADGIELAAKYGIKSVIQPGGSIRDEEVISIANKLDMTMIFTGTRHFFH